jgi:tellurite resistance protein
MSTSTTGSHAGITPNLFGIAYGLAGLAVGWRYTAQAGLAPAIVADILFVVAALVWLGLLAGYLAQVARRPGRWRAELAHPAFGPFVSLIPIVGMLLAIGLLPSSPAAGRWLLGVFTVATIALGGWMAGQWIVEGFEPEQLHPGYVLPTVAGGLIAAIGAALAGWSGLAQTFFGLGLVSWLILEAIIVSRLYLRGPLPVPLRPTLAIEVAPPALAGLAYLAITHGTVDAVAFVLGGYTLLAVMVQLRLIGLYRKLPFALGFWAFAFPYAAVATFTLHWIGYARPPGYQIWAWVVILAISAFIATLAVRTVVVLARQRLPRQRLRLTH